MFSTQLVFFFSLLSLLHPTRHLSQIAELIHHMKTISIYFHCLLPPLFPVPSFTRWVPVVHPCLTNIPHPWASLVAPLPTSHAQDGVSIHSSSTTAWVPSCLQPHSRGPPQLPSPKYVHIQASLFQPRLPSSVPVNCILILCLYHQIICTQQFPHASSLRLRHFLHHHYKQ